MIEHRITSRPAGAPGSSGVDTSFLLGPAVSSVTTVHIAVGDGLGDRPTESWQLLYVLSGLVEVSGADGEPLALGPEQAVQWVPDERRSSKALIDSLVVVINATEQIPPALPGSP